MRGPSVAAPRVAARSPAQVAEDEIWENDTHRVRVTAVQFPRNYFDPHRLVSVRDVDTGRHYYGKSEAEFVAEYRRVESSLTAEELLYRVSDIVRRSQVSDAERVIDALQALVRERKGGSDVLADRYADS